MNRFVQHLLGIRQTQWTGGGDWRVEWRNLPRHDGQLLLLLGAVACLALVIVLYRLEGRNLSRPVRACFVTLRMLVLLGVAAILLEPTIVFRKTDYEPSNLIVLVDRSQSMDLSDTRENNPQSKRIAELLKLERGFVEMPERSRAWLADRALQTVMRVPLAAGGDRNVRVESFAATLLPTDDATTKPAAGDDESDSSVRSSTAIGSALRQALEAYRGQPLAGVLVVTDGQSNAGEAINKAAELAKAEGVPVASLAVGTPEGPRNARLVKIESSPVVFVRDPNPLRVFIESRGMTGTGATLVMEKRRDGGPWEEMSRKPVTLEEAGRSLEVPLEFTEDRPAKLDFRARLEGAGPELTEADNTATAEVRVIRQKIRVLFVAGSTFPEVEFIRNALLRDNGLAASTWLMTADANYVQPGNPSLKRLPNTQEELNDYDCVILYDPDPSLWPTDYPKLLTEFVAEAGGGLIYIAGERMTKNLFDRPDDEASSWLTILPVTSEPGLYRSDVSVQLSSRETWKLEVTPEGKQDPVFQFTAKPDENETILTNLPGMFWHYPVTRAKPGATVLARHGDQRMRNENGAHVLLATQLVGPGRTFFIGFDSTYRWRYLDEQYFDGFWARVADRAGRNKQLGGRYPFTLSTDRASYRPGTQVTLTARFQNVIDRDAALDTLHGELEATNQPPVPITLAKRPGEPGVYEASFEATQPGQYFVRVWSGGDEVRIGRAATLQVQVELPNLEYERPTLDRASLEGLASATGGAVFDLDKVDEVASAFKTRRVARVLEDRQEIFDAPLLAGLVLTALFVEWILRKKYRMV